MAKREEYPGPMQPYMLPELDSNLASYMRNNPSVLYATQMQMRTATPRHRQPLMDTIGGYDGYRRLYANYPKPKNKPVKPQKNSNYGNTQNPNPVESYNDFGELDMGGYMRNNKRKTSITGRSASKNMRKTSYKKNAAPSGPFVPPSIGFLGLNFHRNLSGNEMQRYLESKALSPEQLRVALLANRPKNYDASGKYIGMKDIDYNTPERQKQEYETLMAMAYKRKNPEMLFQDAYEYLFPKYDFEAIRNKSLEALQNSPNGYIQSPSPTSPAQPSTPSPKSSPKSSESDTSDASVAKNPFSPQPKKNPYAFTSVFNRDLNRYKTMSNKNPKQTTNASNNFIADSAMFGEPQNPRKARNLLNARAMLPRLGKSMSKRAIPTQRTANTKNKYGI